MLKRRPQPGEYAPYFDTYISKVEGDDALKILKSAKTSTIEFFKVIPEDKWDYRYAPEKWSVKEVLQHILDTERVFAYRALRVARNDKTPLQGFDENLFAENVKASKRSVKSLLAEYKAVREATIQLFKSMDNKALRHVGTANNYPLTALGVAFMIAGHEIHHLRILKERYLGA